MKNFRNIAVGLTLVLSLAAMASAQNNPCNPCGGKAMKSTQAMGDHDGMFFRIDDPMNRNSITFRSAALLEDIVGTSNNVTGHLVFDPNNPKKGGHGELTVPIMSLNTGIPLRDEHLAGADWLNAAENPKITFGIIEVGNVKSVKYTAGAKTFDVVAVGDFTLNGRTKRMKVPARITYLKESETTKMKLPGNLLAVRSTFEVELEDFSITGPAGMNLVGSKVGESVTVDLSLMGSSATGTMAGNPCGGKAAGATMVDNPCGQKAAKNPSGGKL